MIKKQKTYKYQNYLLKCDFLNKNNNKSIFHYPKIKKIVLDFPVKNINNSIKKNKIYKNLDTDDLNKIVSFYIYLIYLNKFSYIKFKQFALLKSKAISFQNVYYEYSLKTIINNKDEIDIFLKNLIDENLCTSIKKIKKNKNFLTSQYSLNLSLINILGIKNFFEKVVYNFETENLFLRTNILINSYKKFKNFKHFLKNYSYL